MLRRLGSDQRGIAAVEFALLAPVMVLLYCGVAELTMAMMAERRAAHTASVIADLVAQTPQITNSQLTDVLNVGGPILSPFPASVLKLRVTSVIADASASPKVSWSQGSGLGALAVNSTAPGIPAGLLAAGDSVIKADVQYTFTSPLRIVMRNPVTFTDTYLLKPRNSTSVSLIAG
jgi:Flp pilus assembly protein TadG